MPRYDYDCAACGQRVEIIHGVDAPGPTQCPNCGRGPLRKAITAPAVHFKGSGWAKRDRRAAVTAGAAKADDAAATSAESGDGAAPATAPKSDGASDDAATPKPSTPETGKGKRPAATSKGSGARTATKTD